MRIGHVIAVSALLGVCALQAQAGTYYVRFGASGTGTGWGDAFGSIQDAFNAISLGSEGAATIDTIYVEATSGGDSYGVAGRAGSIQRPVDITVSGGWENVDTSAVQTGISSIVGSGYGGGQSGLFINKTGGDHSESATFSVSNFDISGVDRGVYMTVNAGFDNFAPSVTASNLSITSGGAGIEINYNKNYVSHGPSVVNLSDSTILAGQDNTAGAGAAVRVNGPNPQVTITGSTLSSGIDHGVHVTHPSASGGTSSEGNPGVSVTDSTISNSAGDGIHYEDTAVIQYYNKVVEIILNKARIEGNGGDGVDAMTWSNSDWTGGNNTGEIRLSMENSLVADNGENGLKLVGTSDSRTDTAQVEVDILNSTIANNGGDGLFTDTPHLTGGLHEIINTIFAGNTGDAIDVTDGDDSGMTVTEHHNDFFANGGVNLLVHALAILLDGTDGTVDPQFVGTGDDPYQLASGSPLLDAGDPSDHPADDILGVNRPINSGYGPYPSIGAYEAAGAPVPEPATLALLAVGGLALAATRRRRGN